MIYNQMTITLFVFLFVTSSYHVFPTMAFIVTPSSKYSSIHTNINKKNANLGNPSQQHQKAQSISVLRSSTSSSDVKATNNIVENDDITNSYENEMIDVKERCTTLPRHIDNEQLNELLARTEKKIQKIFDQSAETQSDVDDDGDVDPYDEKEKVYANSYVDLSKVDTVGFDFDYTLVTYTDELLELIYDMTLNRLVNEFDYPPEMLHADMKFDPSFSVRGLAVDRETAWICHLSYTHKVAVAYEGRKKVSRDRLVTEYRGKRSLTPEERKKRLKPLNDLFSMAECCLIADVVQFCHDNYIPFCPKNAVVDILDAIGRTHISGDFHRLVAKEPQNYFQPRPHLNEMLQNLKDSGKRLIFVSNSPFWYVDAGMKYVIGDNWMDMWDATIVSAGKPGFYTNNEIPFRQVDKETGRLQFNKVTQLEPGQVYAKGCIKQLTKCIRWNSVSVEIESEYDFQSQVAGGSSLASPNVLYIGDSLFADLVDAKRGFGWTTGAVTPEVGYEVDLQAKGQFTNTQTTIDLLLHTLREMQVLLGSEMRSECDLEVMDKLENLVSLWRKEQNKLLGNPFGSVFRAQYAPSLFAHSLRRYCDLYMSNVSDLRHYSPQHRFYPDDARLLSHEIGKVGPECWDFDEMLENE